MAKSPVREYREIVNDSGTNKYTNRILIGTATTGLVRVEWMQARFGQIVPVNWSNVIMNEWIPGYMPLRYQVADAQNLIVKKAVEMDFEWLLLWEHDVIAPADTLIKLNRYITDEKVPIVSGLYFTRSRPAEPLIFRGRGTGAFRDWTLGGDVWCDGVPTGMLLVHMGIIREMWKDAEEYEITYGTTSQRTRRVFDTPRRLWFDPETGGYNTVEGTSDLEWCTRIMEKGYFARAGWHEYQEKQYPFLVDTSIFCRHINPDGEQFPYPLELAEFAEENEPQPLSVQVGDGMVAQGVVR